MPHNRCSLRGQPFLSSPIFVNRGFFSGIIVLHVFDKDETGSFMNSLATFEGWPIPPNVPTRMPVDRLFGEKSLNLYNFIQRVIGNPAPVIVRRRVEMGNPAKEIIRVAKEERSNLIVLAIKRSSIFSYLIARSILLKLTWRAPCPVLLTRPGSKYPFRQSGSPMWGWVQESHPR